MHKRHPIAALEGLFRPRSVAVVGASNDSLKFGGKVALNIHRSDVGKRYYINSSGGTILEEPAYRSLNDLPEPPDAVVLAVPADVALAELDRAGSMGVRAGVIFAAGFREAGASGHDRERCLKETAGQHGMAVLGPNCIGSANFADSAFLSSADGIDRAEPGSAALIAQSGSLAIAVGSRPANRFRYMISTGNETVIDTAALISHLLVADPGVETFALLMEAIHDRAGLATAAEAARAHGKRVVLLKLAGSAVSAEIAALHTGAISGDVPPLEAFCLDHGILLVRSLRDFNAVLTLLSDTRYRGGERLGIFTTSGGTAVLSAGYASELGLALPQPPASTRTRIAEIFGTTPDRITNPLDTAGIYAFDAQRFGTALGQFAASGSYDVVLVPLGGAGGQNASSRIDAVARVAAQSPVPIVPVWQQQRLLEEEAFHRLYASPLAMFTDFESPIHAMHILAGRTAKELVAAHAAGDDDGGACSLVDAMNMVRGSGLPLARFTVIGPDATAAQMFQKLGSPLALKVSHRRLLHKSDAGMVVFPVTSAEQFDAEIARMRRAILDAGLEGADIVAQEAVSGGVELLCGMARDVEMGPYVVVAAGGIYTEMLRDSQVVLAEPSERLEARIEAAFRRLRIWAVLAGARGRATCDLPAAVAAIASTCRWFARSAGPKAMEVNPLVVLPVGEGAKLVDIRILT